MVFMASSTAPEILMKGGHLWLERGMHCLHLQAQTISPNQTDTESTDASNIDLTIPENAGVNFSHVRASLACS